MIQFDPYDRTVGSEFRALLAGHDAGYWDLPADVKRARRTEATIRARLDEVREAVAASDPTPTTVEAAAHVVDVVTPGRKLPDDAAGPLAAVVVRRESLMREEAVLVEAGRDAAERFYSVLASSHDVLVVRSLRPAFDDVTRQASELAPPLAGLDLTNAEAMIRAGADARVAWVQLQDLMPRWAAILDAHARLLRFERESRAYTPVRNVDEFHPRRTAIMGKVPPPPWPAEPMARLLWYVTTPGVGLWLPTAAEEADVYNTAEAAKSKMPRIMAPTVERPRSTRRPDITTRRHGASAERSDAFGSPHQMND